MLGQKAARGGVGGWGASGAAGTLPALEGGHSCPPTPGPSAPSPKAGGESALAWAARQSSGSAVPAAA